MRKVFMCMIACCLLLGMSGCIAKPKEEVKKPEQEIEAALVCTKEEAGTKIVMTCDAKGDKITRIEQKTSIDISGYKKAEIEQFDTVIEEAKEQYEAIEGVRYTVEIVEKELIECVDIDIDSGNLETLIQSGLVPVSEEEIDFLSLSQTKEMLQNAGWKMK